MTRLETNIKNPIYSSDFYSHATVKVNRYAGLNPDLDAVINAKDKEYLFHHFCADFRINRSELSSDYTYMDLFALQNISTYNKFKNYFLLNFPGTDFPDRVVPGGGGSGGNIDPLPDPSKSTIVLSLVDKGTDETLTLDITKKLTKDTKEIVLGIIYNYSGSLNGYKNNRKIALVNTSEDFDITQLSLKVQLETDFPAGTKLHYYRDIITVVTGNGVDETPLTIFGFKPPTTFGEVSYQTYWDNQGKTKYKTIKLAVEDIKDINSLPAELVDGTLLRLTTTDTKDIDISNPMAGSQIVYISDICKSIDEFSLSTIEKKYDFKTMSGFKVTVDYLGKVISKEEIPIDPIPDNETTLIISSEVWQKEIPKKKKSNKELSDHHVSISIKDFLGTKDPTKITDLWIGYDFFPEDKVISFDDPLDIDLMDFNVLTAIKNIHGKMTRDVKDDMSYTTRQEFFLYIKEGDLRIPFGYIDFNTPSDKVRLITETIYDVAKQESKEVGAKIIDFSSDTEDLNLFDIGKTPRTNKTYNLIRSVFDSPKANASMAVDNFNQAYSFELTNKTPETPYYISLNINIFTARNKREYILFLPTTGKVISKLVIDKCGNELSREEIDIPAPPKPVPDNTGPNLVIEDNPQVEKLDLNLTDLLGGRDPETITDIWLSRKLCFESSQLPSWKACRAINIVVDGNITDFSWLEQKKVTHIVSNEPQDMTNFVFQYFLDTVDYSVSGADGTKKVFSSLSLTPKMSDKDIKKWTVRYFSHFKYDSWSAFNTNITFDTNAMPIENIPGFEISELKEYPILIPEVGIDETQEILSADIKKVILKDLSKEEHPTYYNFMSPLGWDSDIIGASCLAQSVKLIFDYSKNEAPSSYTPVWTPCIRYGIQGTNKIFYRGEIYPDDNTKYITKIVISASGDEISKEEKDRPIKKPQPPKNGGKNLVLDYDDGAKRSYNIKADDSLEGRPKEDITDLWILRKYCDNPEELNNWKHIRQSDIEFNSNEYKNLANIHIVEKTSLKSAEYLLDVHSIMLGGMVLPYASLFPSLEKFGKVKYTSYIKLDPKNMFIPLEIVKENIDCTICDDTIKPTEVTVDNTQTMKPNTKFYLDTSIDKNIFLYTEESYKVNVYGQGKRIKILLKNPTPTFKFNIFDYDAIDGSSKEYLFTAKNGNNLISIELDITLGKEISREEAPISSQVLNTSPNEICFEEGSKYLYKEHIDDDSSLVLNIPCTDRGENVVVSDIPVKLIDYLEDTDPSLIKKLVLGYNYIVTNTSPKGLLPNKRIYIIIPKDMKNLKEIELVLDKDFEKDQEINYHYMDRSFYFIEEGQSIDEYQKKSKHTVKLSGYSESEMMPKDGYSIYCSKAILSYNKKNNTVSLISKEEKYVKLNLKDLIRTNTYNTSNIGVFQYDSLVEYYSTDPKKNILERISDPYYAQLYRTGFHLDTEPKNNLFEWQIIHESSQILIPDLKAIKQGEYYAAVWDYTGNIISGEAISEIPLTQKSQTQLKYGKKYRYTGKIERTFKIFGTDRIVKVSPENTIIDLTNQ